MSALSIPHNGTLESTRDCVLMARLIMALGLPLKNAAAAVGMTSADLDIALWRHIADQGRVAA
jgi:hypothetical protein